MTGPPPPDLPPEFHSDALIAAFADHTHRIDTACGPEWQLDGPATRFHIDLWQAAGDLDRAAQARRDALARRQATVTDLDAWKARRRGM